MEEAIRCECVLCDVEEAIRCECVVCDVEEAIAVSVCVMWKKLYAVSV